MAVRRLHNLVFFRLPAAARPDEVIEDRLGAAFWKLRRWNKDRWQLRHQMRQLKKITFNEPAVIDGNTAADNHRDQDSEPKEDNAFETVSLPETVYVTAKRVRVVRSSERVENSLYFLILAAAVGYLVIAILGL